MGGLLNPLLLRHNGKWVRFVIFRGTNSCVVFSSVTHLTGGFISRVSEAHPMGGLLNPLLLRHNGKWVRFVIFSYVRIE